MSLAPLLDAPSPVIFHTFAAITAFVLGLIQFALPKGTSLHRLLGWIWATLIMSVAISVAWIKSIDDPWSAKFLIVHFLTVCTVIVVPIAVMKARGHRVRAHAAWMVTIFTGALVLAGATAFLPGRIMHAVMFGPPPAAASR